MTDKAPEADWRVFRGLQKIALDRFCTRVLDEADRLLRDASRPAHDRYLDLYRLMRERDRQVSAMFDDPNRSRMVWQAARMHALDLLEPDELERFSDKTRRLIEAVADDVLE
jgi:hypothetical protein